MGEVSSFPWPGKSKLLSSFTLIFSASGIQNRRCFNWLSTRPSKQYITISYDFAFDPRPFYIEQQIPETKEIYLCITKEVNSYTCISLCTHTHTHTDLNKHERKCCAVLSTNIVYSNSWSWFLQFPYSTGTFKAKCPWQTEEAVRELTHVIKGWTDLKPLVPV